MVPVSPNIIYSPPSSRHGPLRSPSLLLLLEQSLGILISMEPCLLLARLVPTRQRKTVCILPNTLGVIKAGLIPLIMLGMLY